MTGFLVCTKHPNEAFTSECPACLKLENQRLWHALEELTVQDQKGDWYVSVIESARINGIVGDLMESRQAKCRSTTRRLRPFPKIDPMVVIGQCAHCGSALTAGHRCRGTEHDDVLDDTHSGGNNS